MINRTNGPDAGNDNLSRVGPAEIVQQNVIMHFNRFGFRGGGVGISHQQSRFFGAMDLAVNGVETVNNAFKLGGKSEVIHRCGKDNHIGIDDVGADKFKIVFENARAVHAAGITGNAGVNLFESGIEAKDFMAGGFGAFNEVVGQGVGIAVWARTSG